jgi:sugar lactone lactonase YvrE
MAITDTTSRQKYTCNGSVTEFSFPHPYQNTADLIVVLVDSDGDETLLVETTDYTVSTPSDTGGTVTTNTAYASGNEILIKRAPASTQGIDWSGVSKLQEGDIEDGFDKLVLQIQDALERLDRTIQLRKSSDLSGLELPADADLAGLIIGFDAAGTAIALYSTGTITDLTDFTNSQHDHSDAANGGAISFAIADFTNSQHDHGDAAGGGNTLDTPTIADMSNATHDHQNAAGGGVLAAPDITSFANAQHDHSDAAGGGSLAGGLDSSTVGFIVDSPIGDYIRKELDISSEDTTPEDVAVSSDGTKIYVLGGANATVFQYTLSTAYDVSTGTYASKSKDVSAQEATPTGLAFSADGTKMYVVGGTNATVYQYTLSTPWDVSTATYATKSKDVSTEEATPTGLCFGNSGLKMYVIGTTDDRAEQYTLSSAYDVSTASYDTKGVLVSGKDNTPTGIAISDDGYKLFTLGTQNDNIDEWTITTQWDINGISAANLALAIGEDATPNGMAFGDSGSKCYVVGATNDKVFQYVTGFLTTA